MSETPTPTLFDALLRVGAPSGYEQPAADIWRAEASSFAEVSSDGIGGSIARVGDAAPLLAVFGHMDEIGLIVKHVDDDGFLWFDPIGDWDPQILVGQRVEVLAKDGPVPGVVGRSTQFDVEVVKRVVELKQLVIDIGALSHDEAAALVRVGDAAVIAGGPVRLAGTRLASRAMDDRVGAYVALESLRRCVERGGPAGSFAAVASVQEEPGIWGAPAAAYKVRPDVAIAVDVWHASGAPGADERQIGRHLLGSGPVIGRGVTLAPKVFELLVETAEAEGIAYTTMGYGADSYNWSSGTDADLLQNVRSGIPTGLVSIPLRYMHSPVETLDLRDVEAAIALLAAFGQRLDASVDLSR